MSNYYSSPFIPVGLVNGRLTTESGVAMSTSDRTSQSTVYFTPFNGNQIALYDGTGWSIRTFTERSLTLSGLTSGKNYDVFIYDNAGTITLELSTAWTSDTARADALTTQDGVLVKSGATTRRYLGTLRTTSTTATEDSAAKRFLWNYYNGEERSLLKSISASYTYASTIRQINADATAQVEVVCGQVGRTLQLTFTTRIETNVDEHGTIDIGENSVAAGASVASDGQLRDFTGTGTDNKRLTCAALHQATPRTGYSYFAMLETATAGTVQWFGGTIMGEWKC